MEQFRQKWKLLPLVKQRLLPLLKQKLFPLWPVETEVISLLRAEKHKTPVVCFVTFILPACRIPKACADLTLQVTPL